MSEESADGARVEATSAHRQEHRVVRASSRAPVGRAGGSARRVVRPPRRAGRHAPCRPSRARARSRDRSRRHRGRARRPRRFASRRSRGARGARGSVAREASRPRRPRAAPRSRRGFGASGSRRERLGASDASGTDAGPKVKRMQERTAARRREIDAGASRSRPPPSAPTQSDSTRASTSSRPSPRRSSHDENDAQVGCRTRAASPRRALRARGSGRWRRSCP